MYYLYWDYFYTVLFTGWGHGVVLVQGVIGGHTGVVVAPSVQTTWAPELVITANFSVVVA